MRTLSVFHYNRQEFAAAAPLMEELLALTPPGEDDPDIRAALEAARRRATGTPDPTLRDAIDAWRDGGRNERGLAALLNLVAGLTIATLREGDAARRETLAADLAALRAARPLPIPGASEFLHLLQLWLRDEPGMAARAAELRAGLPGMFAGVLATMERQIAGEPEAEEEAEPAEATALAGALATMLEAAPPERRPALSQALQQTLPIFQASAAALTNPQVGAPERAGFAARLDELATQAAAGQQPGSPWLDAAAALRAAAAALRGLPSDPTTLAEPFRTLLTPLLSPPGEHL